MSVLSEENPASPAGFYPGVIGERLRDGRWMIVRKLGWGPKSSTWLAKDLHADSNTYEAIKIFTVEATNLNTHIDEMPDGKIEMGVLYILSLAGVGDKDGIPAMNSYFYQKSSRGRHLCLVLSVLGPSIDTLRAQNVNGAYLPFCMTKKIIVGVIDALARVHMNKLVHGAITPDNILLSAPSEAKDIEEYLSNHPTVPPRADGVCHSQPLSDCDLNDPDSVFVNGNIILSNFKYVHSEKIDRPNCTIPSPEAFEGWRITHLTDIWMVGYTTYVLLTGKVPFDQHITSDELYDFVENLPDNLPNTLASIDEFPPEDFSSAAEFILMCLQWEPEDRARDLSATVWGRKRHPEPSDTFVFANYHWCPSERRAVLKYLVPK